MGAAGARIAQGNCGGCVLVPFLELLRLTEGENQETPTEVLGGSIVLANLPNEFGSKGEKKGRLGLAAEIVSLDTMRPRNPKGECGNQWFVWEHQVSIPAIKIRH